MAGASVLLVDDDDDFRHALAEFLAENGYDVVEASSGTEARRRLRAGVVDLVLLDLGLPDIGGLDVLLEIVRSSEIPVIVISGRCGEVDRVIGLEMGADDYVVKPFSSKELLARIHVALRRGPRRPTADPMVFDGLRIEESTHDVTVDGHEVVLTAREFELLAFLAHSPRQVFTRGQLLRRVWRSSDEWQDDNTVAEHVYRLRRKLDPLHRERWIHTVRGVGYRFAPAM
jgi:two-component system phosphate regulon response regulator PhoB